MGTYIERSALLPPLQTKRPNRARTSEFCCGDICIPIAEPWENLPFPKFRISRQAKHRTPDTGREGPTPRYASETLYGRGVAWLHHSLQPSILSVPNCLGKMKCGPCWGSR